MNKRRGIPARAWNDVEMRTPDSPSEYSSSSCDTGGAGDPNAPILVRESASIFIDVLGEPPSPPERASDDMMTPQTEEDYEEEDDRESRGKKGLTHEEMARYGDTESEATQSESEREQEIHKRERKLRMNWHSHPVLKRANALLEEKGVDVSAIAYARLMGAGKGAVDYLVTLPSVRIGRVGYGAHCELKSETKSVSRNHAKLYWHYTLHRWEISCTSKNGMIVDGVPVVPGAGPMPVRSRSLIEIGDVAFFFLSATESVFRVNDIDLLQRRILFCRSAAQYSDEEGFGYPVVDYSNMRVGPSSRGRGRRASGGGRGRMASTKSDRGMGKKKGKKGKKPGPAKKGKPATPQSDFSDSEADEEEPAIPDLLQASKYNPAEFPPLKKRRILNFEEGESATGRKRRKKGRGYDGIASSEELEDGGTNDDWSKKERTDFGRALFALGLDPMYGDDGKLRGFEWIRFRRIAELPRKTDTMITEYYRRFMTDVHKLLDDEEREKREKGPRTKHKKGCECQACEGAARARREKWGEDRLSEGDDEGKTGGKTSDKLVGLVTAQKLRVRLGIHEAALRIESQPAKAVMERLSRVRGSADGVKGFPAWWVSGYHDYVLMEGVGVHGVGQWNDIWEDDALEPFREMREQQGGYMVWPSNQAVMKRVRDLASMINSELKKAAKKEREMKRFAKRKARRYARQARERRHEYDGYAAVDGGESTVEESEDRPASQVETEEDDEMDGGHGDEEVMEEEEEDEIVEEEIVEEIEEEEEELELRRPIAQHADETTDEEDEEGSELVDGQFETASESE